MKRRNFDFNFKRFLPNRDPGRINSLAGKESSWFLNNPAGYILIGLFSGFGNFLFFKGLFINGSADIRPLFSILPWLLIFLVGAVSVRAFCEERRNGTFEILVTLPLTETEIVFGKFFSEAIFLIICLLATITVPMTLFWLGKPDPGVIVSGYLGLILFSSACLSIGIFISTLTKNQVLGTILTILVLFLLLVLGEDLVTQQLPRTIAGVFSFLAMSSHLSNFGHGVVDLRDVIFFLTVSLGFIFLSIKVIENRG